MIFDNCIQDQKHHFSTTVSLRFCRQPMQGPLHELDQCVFPMRLHFFCTIGRWLRLMCMQTALLIAVDFSSNDGQPLRNFCFFIRMWCTLASFHETLCLQAYISRMFDRLVLICTHFVADGLFWGRCSTHHSSGKLMQRNV